MKTLPLVCVCVMSLGSAAAGDLKLWDLLQGRPEAIDQLCDEISNAGLGDDELGIQIDFSAIVWSIFTKLDGEDVAVLILGPELKHWPGNNSVAILIVDTTFKPRAWARAGGEQMFEFAKFDHSKRQLVTFSKARPEGTVVETLTVSLTEISIDATKEESELSLGRPYHFPLKRQSETEPN